MATRDGDEFATRHEFARAVAGTGGGSFDQLFSVRDYARSIGRHWRLFIIAIVVGIGWAFYYEATAPKMYNVSVYVGPVGDAPAQGSSGVSGLVSMFISGGSMSVGPPEWSRYVFALTSMRLAEKLERSHHLVKELNAQRWDAKTKTWKPKAGFAAMVARFFDHLFGLPADAPPDTNSLKQYIAGNVFLATDKTTGITTLSMTNSDPKKALSFILLVHNAAVELVRDEIASRNEAKMDYLTSTLAKTSNADQRTVLIGMLAQAEQTQMLLTNRLPFAAQIIDTPVVPQEPSSPKALDVALIYRIGFLMFLIVMLLAVDQAAGTNIVDYIEAKLTGFPKSIGTRISRFREYGWQGVFSRS